MWELLSNLLPSWGWIAGIGVLPLLALAALAFMGVLGPVAGVAGKAGELAVTVVSGAWSGVVWLFQNIFGPGLKNIASNGSSILTVLALGAFLYAVADHNNTRQEVALTKSRDYFAQELKGFKATLAKTRQELAQCKAMVGKKLPQSGSGWPF